MLFFSSSRRLRSSNVKEGEISLEDNVFVDSKVVNSENVKNPFICGMAERNSYSLGGRITPIGAAFYIAPFVNAMVRSGTIEEN
jgi:hypothetical protein